MLLETYTSVVTFFLLYALLERYITLIVPYKHCAQPVFVSKYVSSIHAIVLCCLSVIYLTGYMGIETWSQLQVIPLGYCIYDLLLVHGEEQLRERVDKSIPLHHFIFIIFTTTVFPYYPTEVSMAYLAELSNPFLHVCYHMIHTPHKDLYPEVFKGCMIGVVLSFTLCRILNFTYLTIMCIYKGYIAWSLLSGTMLYINACWYNRLLNKTREYGLSYENMVDYVRRRRVDDEDDGGFQEWCNAMLENRVFG